MMKYKIELDPKYSYTWKISRLGRWGWFYWHFCDITAQTRADAIAELERKLRDIIPTYGEI